MLQSPDFTAKPVEVKPQVASKVPPTTSSISEYLLQLEAQVKEEQYLIKMDEIRSRRKLDAVLRHERAINYHKTKLQEQKLLLQLDQEREERALRVPRRVSIY